MNTKKPLQIVPFQLPRCVACGSPRLKIYGTDWKEEQRVERYLKCKRCGRKFVGIFD